MGKNALPRHYKPMLATTGKGPFNNAEWQWEVKWDGYRMLAYTENGKVELRSRNDKDYTQRFRILANELSRWKDSAIVDGEVVVLNGAGVSHFNSLENWYSPEKWGSTILCIRYALAKR